MQCQFDIDFAKLALRHAATQGVAHHGMPGLDDLGAVKLGQLRKVAGLADDEFGDARGFGVAIAVPPLQHHPFQQFAG